jgi:hypothetical protein
MRSHLFIATGVAVLILLVQAVAGIAVYYVLPDWPTRGQFGDLFGAINATFSGLAFAGLIYAILLQREDLALQRTELELTRQELHRAAKAQEQSELALRAQAKAAASSARMASTNFLLAHYQIKLDEMGVAALTANDPRAVAMRELLRRKSVLMQVLDAAFLEISEEGKMDDSAKNR